MEILGERLRTISRASSMVTYIEGIINPQLEKEASKGRYMFRIDRPLNFGRDRRWLADYMWKNLLELQHYYRDQGIELRYVTNSQIQHIQHIQGYFIFDWSGK